MLHFSKRIRFVGAVARCTLPILLKHVRVRPEDITILEFQPDEEAPRPRIEKGVKFVRGKVKRDNLGALLGKHVGAGDISSISPGTSTATRSCSGATITACSPSTRRSRSGIPTRTPRGPIRRR